jgi:pSer/pThr/pTyr-binding forkhead associated (FHA) protein
MINVCPQCKAPIPREVSRFCNQCGADLRAIFDSLASIDLNLSGASIELYEKPSEMPEEALAPNSAALRQYIQRTTMAPPIDDAKLPRPEAVLRIVLRDGSVVERDVTQNEVAIGKGPQNDIILPDASVSTAHAVIRFEEGIFKIMDLGSRNGTMVNDVRVSAEAREIHHGDLIKMGHCALTFRLKEAGDTLTMPPRTLIMNSQGEPIPPPAPPTPKAAALTEDALADALVASGAVSQEDVERLRGRDAQGRRLYRALIEEQLATETGLRDLMSRTFNIPPVELKTLDVDASAAMALRKPFLLDRLICPVVMQPNHLALAVADPTDKAAVDEAERVMRKRVMLRLTTPSEIAAHLVRFFNPRLVGVMPSGEKIESIIDQLETEIGKAPHNRVVLSDPTVSGTHAIILARDGGYNIADLGSSNGTFVNGRKLGNESHVLQHGDKIQLGQALLTFRNPAETVEAKTARLSPEALEEIRFRATTRPAYPVQPGQRPGAQWPQVVAAVDDDDEDRTERRKKKKDKEKDKNSWFSANALSRIVAQVLGAVATGVITIFLIRSGMQGSGGNSGGGGQGPVVRSDRLTRTASWERFNLGFISLGTVEASGVAYAPGLNGVLFVPDSSEGEVDWMQLDENGEQVGKIVPIPLNVSFKDPEALTYGNSYFYLITSQSNPANGMQNALVRFEIDPETRALRGQPEIITDFRSFLLQNVPTIATSGAPDGRQGGLNIEGLAWDPNKERLLLGLRGPQIGGQGGQAALVPIKLRDPRGKFTLENLKVDQPEVMVLSLGGQAVRDITYDPQLKSFLIISGIYEGGQRTDFGLWEWDGQSPTPVKLMTLEDDEKPEGVTSVTVNGRSYVFVVGDSGRHIRLDYKQ